MIIIIVSTRHYQRKKSNQTCIACDQKSVFSKPPTDRDIRSWSDYIRVSRPNHGSTLWWSTWAVETWCGIFNENRFRNDVRSFMRAKSFWRSNISTARASFTVTWSWTTFCWAWMGISRLRITVFARRTCGMAIRRAPFVVLPSLWHPRSCWSKSMDEQWIGGLWVSWSMKCCLDR